MEYQFYKTEIGEIVAFSATDKTSTPHKSFTKVDEEIGYKQFPHLKEQKYALKKLKEQLKKS